MHKEKLLGLFKRGISESPLMLHGTSVESLLRLLETGILPSGNTFEDATRNYLYFVPVRKNLKGTEFYSDLKKEFTTPFAFKSAGEYAAISAEEWYIVRSLVSVGVSPPYAEKITFNWSFGYRYKIPEEERKREKLLNWKSIVQKARRRKGAILEINDKIFEFELSLDPDKDGLRAYCPEGLDLSYISGLKILGNEEKIFFESILIQ